MKKLVVLMLVVGMASLASAALSFSGSMEVNVDGSASTFALTSSADATIAEGWIWVDYPVYASQLSNAAMTANVDDNGLQSVDNTKYAPSGLGVVAVNNTDGTTAVWAGDLVTFDMVAAEGAVIGDTYSLQFLDGSFGEQFSTTVTVVPEPMTMALLGLGGLFLRRKK